MNGSVTSQAARELAAQRIKTEKQCAACGEPYVGLKASRYCSAVCRWREEKRRYRDRKARRTPS